MIDIFHFKSCYLKKNKTKLKRQNMASKNENIKEEYNVPLAGLPLKFSEHNDLWVNMQLEYFMKYIDTTKVTFSIASGSTENLPDYQLRMDRRSEIERIKGDQEKKENVIQMK
jgi:hypothetical protein